MSYTSFTFAMVGVNFAQDFLTVEDGDLVAVSISPTAIGTGNAEFYTQLFIASTEPTEPIPIAFLASGYFGASVHVGWTGRIKMQPTYSVLARIWTESAIPVRCTILTE